MRDQPKPAVGFVGLGNMGQPMAMNLVRAGFALTVFDQRADRMAPVRELGATVAASLAEVTARSAVVITMLPDTPDVETVLTGPDGVLTHGRPEQLLMDMSTINPAASRRFAGIVEDRGLAFVDAAVGRSALHAARAESLFMVGAHEQDLTRVRPLLDAMGDTVIHCGPPGSGVAMKIVNNFLGNVQAQVTAEALTLGARMGLSAEQMVEVMCGSLAVNGFLTSYYPVKALAGDIEPGFALRLAHKDLSIAIELAAELDVPVRAGAAARERVGGACERFGDKDVTALLDAAATAAGLRPLRFRTDRKSGR